MGTCTFAERGEPAVVPKYRVVSDTHDEELLWSEADTVDRRLLGSKMWYIRICSAACNNAHTSTAHQPSAMKLR